MSIAQPAVGFCLPPWTGLHPAGRSNDADTTHHSRPGFGADLQAGDLYRPLSFYRDVLGLEVVWNDGGLAVLHSHRVPADSLVIREDGNGRPA